MGFKLRYRKVNKGYDPVNEVEDPGYKRVETRRGDKLIVKEKYIDDTGRRRKLKTIYEGYSGLWTTKPDIVSSKTFTAKGGGKGRVKQDMLESPAQVRKTEKGANLKRWFKEEWIDVRMGKPCGRSEGEKRGVPYCRPKKRISSKTPKTASEMSASEKAKKIKEKKALGQPKGKPRRVKPVKRKK